MVYYNECAYCKGRFKAFRSDSKTCSDTCRVKYNGLNKKLSGYLASIISTLDKIEAMAKDFPEFAIELDETLQIIGNVAHKVQYGAIDANQLKDLTLIKELEQTGGLALWHCSKCGKIVQSNKPTVKDCKCEGMGNWKLQRHML